MKHSNIKLLALMASIGALSLVVCWSLWQPKAIFRLEYETTVLPRIHLRTIQCTYRSEHFTLSCLLAKRDALTAHFVSVSDTDIPLKRLLYQPVVCVINGGYFDEKNRPLGLLRIDGNTVSPLARQSPLSGCVVIDHDGRIGIVPFDSAAVADAGSARQCGPFLFDPDGRFGIKSDAKLPAERTVIAISNDHIAVISTTPVSLTALAACLRDEPNIFGLENPTCAINLDGGPSAGFLAKTGDSIIGHEPRGRIADAIVFTPSPLASDGKHS